MPTAVLTRENRKFRNGGSFSSNLNANYTWKNLYNATGSFTFNRFANPQGTVRSNLSMRLGLQARLLQKKLIATLNIIDPFAQQQNHSFTYGTSFTQENFNSARTRSYRLSVSYVLSKSKRKRSGSAKDALRKALPAAKN